MIKIYENNGNMDLEMDGNAADLITEYVVITQKLYEALSIKMGEVISEVVIKKSVIKGIAMAKQKRKDNPMVPEVFIHDPRRYSK